MGKREWGPPLWNLLHSITFNYPDNPTEKNKKLYKNFFYKCVPKMILCMYCRSNYISKINKKIIKLTSKNKLIDWLIEIHNDVNIQNGSTIFSREQANYKYTHFDHRHFYNLFNIFTTNELKNSYFLSVYISILKYMAFLLPCEKCRNFIISTFKNKTSRQSYYLILKYFNNSRLGKSTCLSI